MMNMTERAARLANLWNDAANASIYESDARECRALALAWARAAGWLSE